VVVDTPSQFTDHVLAAMDLADVHVLLATPEVPALKSLRVTLDMMDLLKLPPERRVVVLNRSDSRVGLAASDVERVLKIVAGAAIPSSRDVPITINRGIPIVRHKPKHPVSRALRALAKGSVVPAAHPEARTAPVVPGLAGRLAHIGLK
jgi:pilus assembly protein CpaE